MNKIKNLGLMALPLIATGGVALAEEGGSSATVDGIVTSAGSLLTSIYPIVIGAVGFGILVSLVKVLKKK